FVLAFVLALGLMSRLGWAPISIGEPALYRALHLTSGVSPLPPFLFLLAAGLWRAWYSLTALSFLDERRPQLPTIDDLRTANAPIVPRLAPLSETMELSEEEKERCKKKDLSEARCVKLIQVMDPWNLDRRVWLYAAAVTLAIAFAVDIWHP